MANPNFQVAPGGSYIKLGDIYVLSGSANPSEVPVYAPQGSVYARSGLLLPLNRVLSTFFNALDVWTHGVQCVLVYKVKYERVF